MLQQWLGLEAAIHQNQLQVKEGIRERINQGNSEEKELEKSTAHIGEAFYRTVIAWAFQKVQKKIYEFAETLQTCGNKSTALLGMPEETPTCLSSKLVSDL